MAKSKPDTHREAPGPVGPPDVAEKVHEYLRANPALEKFGDFAGEPSFDALTNEIQSIRRLIKSELDQVDLVQTYFRESTISLARATAAFAAELDALANEKLADDLFLEFASFTAMRCDELRCELRAEDGSLVTIEVDEAQGSVSLRREDGLEMPLSGPTFPRLEPVPMLPEMEAGARVAAPANPAALASRIRSYFERMIKAVPREAYSLAEALVDLAKAKLPPLTERTLGLRQAAERITKRRGKSLSHSQLARYHADKSLGIGAKDEEGKPVFSEAECDAFIPPVRKPGPKAGQKKGGPKNSSSGQSD